LIFNDCLPLQSNVSITVCDINGEILNEFFEHNLVVTSGRNLIRDLLNSSTTGLTHFAIGTSTATVTSTQTTLGVEVFIDLITQTIASAAQLSVKYFLGTADANGSTLTEAGIFNSSASGAMYSRVVHTGVVKSVSTTISYTWDLTWTTT
jgi:hypothetical protein